MYPSLNEIRAKFLAFFSDMDHCVLPSSSLIPGDDPTLLFANSGMVQFKDIFLGRTPVVHPRVTTCQKCVRAGGKHNDLENVGYTARHHTFFEMLGNFSFGDYFKERAIELAWTFLTKHLEIPKDKLFITVHHQDNESRKLWSKLTGFGDERIITVATADNFWSMGDAGPCGPCSEIFYDYGEKFRGTLTSDNYDPDERFVEIWNLVFMQNNLLQNGTMEDLPIKCIDTGMGIERIAAACRGAHDNYQVDVFQKIIERIRAETGDSTQDHNSLPARVIADHARSASFLISDGVTPSNMSRGYALRKIIRRAIRYSLKIPNSDHIVSKLVPCVVDLMCSQYPEIEARKSVIIKTIEMEESQFSETISSGMQFLSKQLAGHGRDLPDDLTFKLYDTYGFPFDLTKEILREHNVVASEEVFDRYMDEQRARGKESWKSKDSVGQIPLQDGPLHATKFVGYDEYVATSKILSIVHEGQSAPSLQPGQCGMLILDKTPFYATSGGQIGDSGYLSKGDAILARIINCEKVGSAYIHECEAVGTLSIGDDVVATIDVERRRNITRNHSAAHLLHYALRKVLGEHVVQKGSSVTDERLRFDFSHGSQLSEEEIRLVESCVNDFIDKGTATSVDHMELDRAKKMGAAALFGEKYGNEVRVVTISSDSGDSSVELCGGSHVSNATEIRLLKIVSVSAIGSGIRRIEAVTGKPALEFLQNNERVFLSTIAALRASRPEDAVEAAHKAVENNKVLGEKIKDLSGYIQSHRVLVECIGDMMLTKGSDHALEAHKILEQTLEVATRSQKKLADMPVDSLHSSVDIDNTLRVYFISMGTPRFATNYIEQIVRLSHGHHCPVMVVAMEFISQQFCKLRVAWDDAKHSAGLNIEKMMTNAVSLRGKITKSGIAYEAGFSAQHGNADNEMQSLKGKILEYIRAYIQSNGRA